MKLSNENKGTLYAIISGLFYGLVGYFGISVVHANFSISNMLFWRFLISILLIILFLTPKIRQIKINDRAIWGAFISGAIFYSSSSVTYFMASSYIGTGLSMVIFFTYPAFVMFGMW